MKLLDAILLALSLACLMIGIHQAMLNGYQNSYFLFMLSSGFFLWYTLRKRDQPSSGKPRRTLMKPADPKKKAEVKKKR